MSRAQLVSAALSEALGEPLEVTLRGAGGGCINSAAIAEAGGRTWFLKWNERPLPRQFEAEARGLEAMRAAESGLVIPAVIAGSGETYVPEPWFWSDQYDVKLQIAGYNGGYDHTVVRQGAREGAASVWYFRGDRLLAVDAVNDARAYVCAKKLLAAGSNPSPDVIADPATDLKALAAQ